MWKTSVYSNSASQSNVLPGIKAKGRLGNLLTPGVTMETILYKKVCMNVKKSETMNGAHSSDKKTKTLIPFYLITSLWQLLLYKCR